MPERSAVGATVVAVLGAVVLGLAVGTLGTLVHRQWAPVMLVAALVATLGGGVWMRAWRGLLAALPYAIGWTVATQVLAGSGPGGNVLVAAQPIGYVWIYGGAVAAFGVFLLPERWIAPRGGAGQHPAAP